MAKRTHRCGIYAIEQIGTDRLYIGSSADMDSRWATHRRLLDSGKHTNPQLRRAWEKHGAAAFRIIILEECARVDLLEREQAYMDGLQPWFNVAPKAGTPPPATSEFVGRLRARMAAITHCPKGHAYDDVNTYRNSTGKRRCRACAANHTSGVYVRETPEQREARRQAVKAHYEANKPQINAQMREYAAARKDQKRAYDQARAEQKREADHKRRAVANLTSEQLEAQRQARRDHYHRDPERTKLQAHEHYIRRRDRMREASWIM